MTQDEKHAEIGRMHVEAKNLRRTLSCLENKKARTKQEIRDILEFLGTADTALEAAEDVLNIRNEKTAEQKYYSVRFPTAQEVFELLFKIEATKQDLAGVDERLKDC